VVSGLTNRMSTSSPKGDAGTPQLAAVCLTDVLDDGLSMVYSFFDPARNRDSLGTSVILDHIRIARDARLPYVYLGDWRPLGDPKALRADTHPLSTAPIAEQVARINLPNTRPTGG